MRVAISLAWLVYLLIQSACLWADSCSELTADETVSVKTIYDGDTIQLSDNRRVRLLSINTPEMARENNPAQALAVEARDAVSDFLANSKTIYLTFGQRKQDRYQRLLAHISNSQHQSLEAYLVERGLAFPLAVPPDTQYSACLRELADRAREQNHGIWQHSYWQAIPATESAQFTQNFRRVCGTVAKIDSAGALWIELQGELVIHIDRNDWPFFEKSDFDLTTADNWIGKSVELWGWLQDRRKQRNIIERGFKPWSIQARSPYVMRWIDRCEYTHGE